MDDKKKDKKEEKILNQVQDDDRTEEEKHIENKEETVAKEEFDALKDLATQLEGLYKRAVADYQNLQRRTQEEKQEWARLSNRDLVLKLLPILDTLMLAEKHTKDQTFVLTVQQFLQVLRDDGIARIETVGKEFDPMLMEVVETRTGANGKVLEEAKAGFIAGEVVLRPALVVVGRKE